MPSRPRCKLYAECAMKLYPDDPEACSNRPGNFAPCLCDHCRGYITADTEAVSSAPLEPEWEQRQWGYVQQVKAEVAYLNRKVVELQGKKDKSKVDYEPF